MKALKAAAANLVAPNPESKGVSGRLGAELRRVLSRRQKEWLRSVLSWLPAFHRHGKSRVRALRRKLQVLGFVERAYADLAELIEVTSNPSERRAAARELALYHLNEGSGLAKALSYLATARKGEKQAEERRQLSILEAEALSQLGKVDEARARLQHELDRRTDADLLLGMANLQPDLAGRLERINAALALSGLEPMRLLDRQDANPYDRLTVDDVDALTAEMPRITVIVSAYNAEETIGTALRSLLEQNWRNQEILVVDDGSRDGSADVVRCFRERDDRIRLIKAPINAGTYVARNLALQQATGEFVTCHDADDWSHPRKLELQARDLMEHPLHVANVSLHARASESLFIGRHGMGAQYRVTNFSSLMFRRETVLDAIGYWDSVRFGADGEFKRRLEWHFGEKAVATLDGALTSFPRTSDTSLTRDKHFGRSGRLVGARREYFDASARHHAEAAELKYSFPMTQRPFPVPEPMRPDRVQGLRHFDVIIASDFRLEGGTTISSIEEVEAQAAAGLRTGLIQLARYDVDPWRTLHPRVRALMSEEKAELIVSGESVRCDLLLVRYPPILQELQIGCPEVVAGHTMVVVNQPPMSDYGPGGIRRYEIPRCVEHFARYFDIPARWWPIGPAVREALVTHHAADLGAIELSDRDWFNIIDVDFWRREGRPDPTGRRPRIGRHARDHKVKWPGVKSKLLSVYPDDPAYEVVMLGGAEVPRQMLGSLPANWRVLEFNEVHPREYLAELDVFLYYPHADWVEAFGRTLIEAIAAGVPVVVPPVYKALLQDAALYAEPDQALETVDRLIKDPDLYDRQVAVATAFVRDNFGYAMHIRRLSDDFGVRARISPEAIPATAH